MAGKQTPCHSHAAVGSARQGRCSRQRALTWKMMQGSSERAHPSGKVQPEGAPSHLVVPVRGGVVLQVVLHARHLAAHVAAGVLAPKLQHLACVRHQRLCSPALGVRQGSAAGPAWNTSIRTGRMAEQLN